MATQLVTKSGTKTPHQAAVRSTVARKVLMALTGLILVAFLLMHMFGNLKLLSSGEDFDHYAESLRTFLYPILPKKFFLWCFRIALAFSALVHIFAAISLTFRKYDSRGGIGRARYVKQRYLEGSMAARTMIWGGIIVLIGVVFHLLQFTTQTIRVGYETGQTDIEPHLRVIHAFQEPLVWALYLIWLAAVSIHVLHGFYSAFVTLGARFGAATTKVWKACGLIVALVVFFGFMLVPTLIMFGVIS